MFCVICAALFVLVDSVLARKTGYADMMSAFHRIPNDSVDVLGVGSSHMYCTLCPVELYRNTGISSFVLGTQMQPIEVSYEYIRRAVKSQPCKVVILETFMLVRLSADAPVDEGDAHAGLDPLPLDLGKMATVCRLHLNDGIENYLFPFLKYHGRWRELEKRDFMLSWIPDRAMACHGFTIFATAVTNDLHEIHCREYEPLALDREYVDLLNRIHAEVKSAGGRLLLLTAPCPLTVDARRKYGWLHRYAEERGIDYLDLNAHYDALGIDAKRDFYDDSHLNVFGAEKATRYIGKYLLEHYDLNTKHAAEVQAQWDSACGRYDRLKAAERKKAPKK